MKNLKIFIAVALVAAFTFSSCSAPKPKLPELKTQLDSLNYALGLAYGENLKTNYVKGDSADKAVKLIFEGIEEASKTKVDKENEDLVTLGGQIGSSLKQQKKTGFLGDSALVFDYKLVKQGIINSLKGATTQFSPKDAQNYLQVTMSARQAVKMEKQFGPAKIAGEKFLAENAKKAGVVTTASGLQYEVIKKGTGAIPTEADRVKVNYHGTLIDGTVFDSSVERKEPVVFQVGGVIKGWTEALKLMPVGSKYKIYVPQQLGYGSQGSQGKITPFATLIFEVELLSIEKAEAAAPQMSAEQMQQIQQQMQQQQK